MPTIGTSRNQSHDQAKLPVKPVMKKSATAMNGVSAMIVAPMHPPSARLPRPMSAAGAEGNGVP
ncbi:hypothetical protein ACWEOH_07105 [Agromyces sp. NPDC004153]